MAYFNIITPAVQPYGMGIFNCRSNNNTLRGGQSYMEPYVDNAPELYEIAFQPSRLAAGPDATIQDITEAETI